MAHPIEPVTRQRDDQARPKNRSRLWSLVSGGLRSAYAYGSPRLPQSGHGQMRERQRKEESVYKRDVKREGGGVASASLVVVLNVGGFTLNFRIKVQD
ncbi:hypothetical protein HZ326_29680 [Fusarium oxysporum f. sp. albedinis]|nr:Thymidylate synthase [Fusarium oxysporum f. sp. albedinis]KAJ0127218.1 hypothetical protein HZ326_29680 [Fusarium oxysporum f. sp. albedinis]